MQPLKFNFDHLVPEPEKAPHHRRLLHVDELKQISEAREKRLPWDGILDAVNATLVASGRRAYKDLRGLRSAYRAWLGTPRKPRVKKEQKEQVVIAEPTALETLVDALGGAQAADTPQ